MSTADVYALTMFFFGTCLGMPIGIFLCKLFDAQTTRYVGPVRYRLSPIAAIIGKIYGPIRKRKEKQAWDKAQQTLHHIGTVKGYTAFKDTNRTALTHLYRLHQSKSGRRLVEFESLHRTAVKHDHPLYPHVSDWETGLREIEGEDEKGSVVLSTMRRVL